MQFARSLLTNDGMFTRWLERLSSALCFTFLLHKAAEPKGKEAEHTSLLSVLFAGLLLY